METYTCHITRPHSQRFTEELEASTVIYNDILLNDNRILYTIYCARTTAQQLKSQGYPLVNVY